MSSTPPSAAASATPGAAASAETSVVTIQSETEIQSLLQVIFGGGHKRCEGGIVDIVTDDVLVEIKVMERWRDAIGQLMVYRRYFPGRRTILYLFGKQPKRFKWDDVRDLCESEHIDVMWHEEDYAALRAEYEKREMARVKQDPITATEHLIDDQDVSSDEERSRFATRPEFKIRIDAFVKRLKDITGLFRKIPVDDSFCQTSLIEIMEGFEQLFTRFQAVYGLLSDSVHRARLFLRDCLTIEKDAELPLYEFDATLRGWCSRTGCKDYAKIRRSTKLMLQAIDVKQVKRRGGSVFCGVRLQQQVSAGGGSSILGDMMALAATPIPLPTLPTPSEDIDDEQNESVSDSDAN